MPSPQIEYTNTRGEKVAVDFDHQMYKEASDKQIDVGTLLYHKCPGIDLGRGTPMEQAAVNAGLFVGTDGMRGMGSPSLATMMSDHGINMSGIRASDGNATGIAARMLFPQIILETIAASLTKDDSDFIGGYNSMVAITRNVNGSKVDQPKIDVTANESVAKGQIAQLAEPASLVNITVADTTKRIPTESIGLMISDEALQVTTLDLVNLALTAHAKGERTRRVETNISNMVSGDTDLGISALPSQTAQSFDAAVTGAGEITKKAWIKFLREKYQTRSLNAIMMDLDTALLLDAALIPNDHTADRSKLHTGFGVRNLGIADPQVLLVDTAVVGANTIIGLDTRYAIQRVVNVSAEYQAIEEFLLRKAKAFRIDHGEMSTRLYDEAWSKMTLTV